jgi:pyridinium-3,5-biscarboxylic acid mononucleotide sulfurtransferase
VINTSIESQLSQLRQLFTEMGQAVVAYSGGIDSTLVAKVAYDVLGDRALAVTAKSPSLLPEELEDAIDIAAQIGIRHQIVETHELENPNYANNPIDRCYFCKSELHDTLKPLAIELGYPYVIDGVNADDLQDYRPGIQAAKERGVRSPLAELEMSKLAVREMAKMLGLTNWNKPAQPCLSSRFPYGEAIDLPKLQRVGRAEIYLRRLGFDRVRVRSHGDTARIELPPTEIRQFAIDCDFPQLVTAFQSFGFSYVTLDLEGYISGKLNRDL